MLLLSENIAVPSRTMTPAGEPPLLPAGWWELLLKVAWSTDDTTGTRFCHTKLPNGFPAHSEAINADVLSQLSGGRQLLRAVVTGPLMIAVEVWQDADAELDCHVELGAVLLVPE